MKKLAYIPSKQLNPKEQEMPSEKGFTVWRKEITEPILRAKLVAQTGLPFLYCQDNPPINQLLKVT